MLNFSSKNKISASQHDQGEKKGADSVLAQADQARDNKDFQRAADFYERHLQDHPNDAAIHVQCGHMNKEVGRFDTAEQHYLEAQKLTPEDADLSLQLGHLYKVAGRIAKALTHYKHAESQAPNWPEPRLEAAELEKKLGNLDLGYPGRSHKTAIDSLAGFELDGFIAGIAESKDFHLLEGLDRRLDDPAMSQKSILTGLQLCIDSTQAELLARCCRQVANTKRLEGLPPTLLADAIDAVLEKQGRDSALRTNNIPVEAQNAMLNVSIGLLSRQRFLIEHLIGLLQEQL